MEIEEIPVTDDVPNGEMVQMKKRKGKKRRQEPEQMDTIQVEDENHGPTVTKRRQMGEMRKVPIPPHRYTPLKENWMKIYTPVVENLKLQIRFNLKTRNVELRSCNETEDIGHLQKAQDFIQAFVYGFDVADALTLIRLEDLFMDTFQVQDVKSLKGDHLSRAIGRLAGKGGKTKYTIENATKTRIVLADSKVHILGAYQNIQLAKRAICNLILGAPPSKVYGTLRAMSSRISDRF